VLGEVVDAEGIGQGHAVAAGARGVVRVDDHVDDPAEDEEMEDNMGGRDEYGEDDEMEDALGVLLVVHGANAGDEAEERGQAGVGLGGAVRLRRRITGGAGVSIAGGWGGGGDASGEAGLAEDGGADVADAFSAEGLAAVLAEGDALTVGMVGAVHTRLPSMCLRSLRDA
jgi:hypothetical protein